MHFQLPSALQQELLAYDPKLKALAKETKAKTTKKSKFPLGKIPCLIPTHIVREQLQHDAIEQINQQPAPQRFHRFTKVVDVATPQARTITTAILYHFEQCWYAAWLPGKDDDYIYGYAYAFKDTAAAAKVVPNHIWNSREHYDQYDLGRGSVLYSYIAQVTKQHILDGEDGRRWRAMNVSSWSQKGREITEAICRFEETLKTTIPTWEDSRSMFERFACKNIWDALDIRSFMFQNVTDKEQLTLTVDTFITLAKNWTDSVSHVSSTYHILSEISHIISKPVIKKQLQAALDRSLAAYQDDSVTHRKCIRYGYKEFTKVCTSIHKIHTIWPDTPIDYYQNYYEELRKLDIVTLRTYTPVTNWLREHMPVASFFNMLRKTKEKLDVAHPRLSSYSDHDYITHSLYEMNDTFSMLARLLEHGKTVEPPKRWRMPDFHDYVQAENWKIQNPKLKLHQDLFPQPVRIDVDGEAWTFLQPMDTHQLSQWGQAVRNCVGSASQYAENIKKRKHFIVLCMVGSKPTFTIQMDVSMGVMNVKQIAGVANQRLSDDERDKYSTAFQQALQQRESELNSKSWSQGRGVLSSYVERLFTYGFIRTIHKTHWSILWA